VGWAYGSGGTRRFTASSASGWATTGAEHARVFRETGEHALPVFCLRARSFNRTAQYCGMKVARPDSSFTAPHRIFARRAQGVRPELTGPRPRGARSRGDSRPLHDQFTASWTRPGVPGPRPVALRAPLRRACRLGSVLGYLAAGGASIGPFGLGLVQDVESIGQARRARRRAHAFS